MEAIYDFYPDSHSIFQFYKDQKERMELELRKGRVEPVWELYAPLEAPGNIPVLKKPRTKLQRFFDIKPGYMEPGEGFHEYVGRMTNNGSIVDEGERLNFINGKVTMLFFKRKGEPEFQDGGKKSVLYCSQLENPNGKPLKDYPELRAEVEIINSVNKYNYLHTFNNRAWKTPKGETYFFSKEIPEMIIVPHLK